MNALQTVELFVHLPGMSVDGPLSIEDGWTLDSPSFDQWLQLDSWIVGKRRGAYERSRPVFVTSAASTAQPVAELIESAVRYARDLQRALMLVTGASFLDVAVSMAYASAPTGIYRQMGPAEREAVTLPGPTIALEASMIPQIRATLGLLRAARAVGASGEIDQAFDRLADAALPDFEPIDGVVHTTVALEALLVPDLRSGVTAGFAERGAAFLAGTSAEVEAMRDALRHAYAVRSDALHGRDIHATVASSGHPLPFWAMWTRAALCRGLSRVLAVLAADEEPTTALDRLRAALDEGRATGARWEGPDHGPVLDLP